jgi:hypothetical protein
MTRTEHLLTILAEECAEVAQRVSKALRFGIDEVEPGQKLTNAERIKIEFVDLFAVWGLLCRANVVLPLAPLDEPAVQAKQQKVEKFLDYSIDCGSLEASDE